MKKMHAERMIYIVKTFVKRSARCSPPLFVLLWRKRFIILTRIRLRFLFVLKYEVFQNHAPFIRI